MLPSKERIRKGRKIKEALKIKQFHFSSPLLYFSAMENGEENSKIAVSCSKKLGPATVRNRTKRQIMGGYAKIKHKIAKNINIVIVPKVAAAGALAYEAAIGKGIRNNGLCKE